MSSKTFNCGDLVAYSKGYDNGISIYWWCRWCRLLDIMVDGQSHHSYDIVTGQGDENTNALFKLQPLGISYDSIWDFSRKIEPLNEEVIWTQRTHDIILIETDNMERLYREMIKTADDKIQFIRKYRNRDEKIEELM